MRQRVEIISRTSQVKERRTAKGWLYSFAIPVTSTDRSGSELTEWLQCNIFQKDQRPDVMRHQGELHLIGELQVQSAWGDHPPGDTNRHFGTGRPGISPDGG